MSESAPVPPAAGAAGGVPLRARLSLSRAAVQVLADRAGCRLLHIKGEAVDPALGPPRYGSDVDVIADPSRIAALHRTLREHGWRVYSTFRFASSFEHAQTYLHETWGYLDLHRRFPGIGLPDQAAFERLWAARTERETAGIAYRAPSLDAQVVILVLNAVRGGAPVPAVWEGLDGAARRRCADLAVALRAEVAFAAAFGRLAEHRWRREYLLWRVTTQGGPRVAEWWGRVLAQPTFAEAVRVVAQAPLVNTDRLGRRLGRRPTRADVFREFFARAGRAVHEGATMLLRGGKARR